VILGPAYSPRTAVEFIEFQYNIFATPLDVNFGRAADGEMFHGPTRFGPLIRNGGIQQIPFSQMVEYGWHRRPEIVKVIPELGTVVDIPCEHGCPTEGPRAKRYITVGDYQEHCSVMHTDVAGSDAMGRTIKEAIEAIGKSNSSVAMNPVDIAAAVVLALKEMDADSKTSKTTTKS